MYVAAGAPFTATLVDPGGLTPPGVNLGARIEVPVTRAIVGNWVPAQLSGIVWSVDLDAPPLQVGSQVYGYGGYPALQAALDAGEFNIVWMDGLDPPSCEIFVPLVTTASSGSNGSGTGVPPDWPDPDPLACSPSVDDVAALERTRTIDDVSNDEGTFTSVTTPSDTEVSGLITQAVPVVLAELLPQFDPGHYPTVAHCVALYTAILIEGSYHREQLNEGAVQLWRTLYMAGISGLQTQINEDLQQVGSQRLT